MAGLVRGADLRGGDASTYVAMVWCVFVYAPTEKTQGIAQRIFYFLVSPSGTMFVAFFVVFVASIIYLWKRGELTYGVAAVTYVAMVAALWCIFVYVPTEKVQGIVQRIFYFHVSSAGTMFVAFFVVFVASIIYPVETRRMVGPDRIGRC